MATREEIYDNEINPLMAKIIGICKEHDIPLVAAFQINDDRSPEPDGVMLCRTVLTYGENVSERLHQAARELKPKHPTFMAFTISTRPPEG
jgi:hypothetical protein